MTATSFATQWFSFITRGCFCVFCSPQLVEMFLIVLAYSHLLSGGQCVKILETKWKHLLMTALVGSTSLMCLICPGYAVYCTTNHIIKDVALFM